MARLGVNVDHVATVRQARGTNEPDPVTAAALAELAGADRDSTDYGGVALYAFRATGLHGIPAPGDDASEVMWLAPSEIPPLAFPAHDRALGRGRRGTD